MNAVSPKQIDSAIGTLCPEIWRNMQSVSNIEYSEEILWEELVCCVLSSQVKYEISQAVTKEIKQKGFLDIEESDNKYGVRLGEFLKSPIVVKGRSIKYRFPNIKAKQIAAARENIYGNGVRLRELLSKYSDPSELRSVLIKLVPGLGMKQASMYIRNVYKSFELAVIDSHVLKYMNLMDLVKSTPSAITQKQYLIKEELLIKFIKKFGYPVGCVDYAIWVVMRVASKDGYL